MAQNEMEAMGGMPQGVRLSEWLGRISATEAGCPSVELHVRCLLRAQPAWIWSDTQATKVKAICVPACCDGWVLVNLAVTMPDAGLDEQGQILRPKTKSPRIDTLCKQRCTGPMLRIWTVRPAAGVMKKGEALHNAWTRSCASGKPSADVSNPSPMRSPMDSMPIKHETLANCSEQRGREHAA
jgi:hypothetical protein